MKSKSNGAIRNFVRCACEPLRSVQVLGKWNALTSELLFVHLWDRPPKFKLANVRVKYSAGPVVNPKNDRRGGGGERYNAITFMLERAREKIGPFIVSAASNLESNHVVCTNCSERLASVRADGIEPSPEILISQGAVAWPNFGWFCSRACEDKYSREFQVSCAERVVASDPENTPTKQSELVPWSMVFCAVNCAACLFWIVFVVLWLAEVSQGNIGLVPSAVAILIALPAVAIGFLEWLLYSRQARKLERPLGIFTGLIGLLALFGLISNIGEAIVKGGPSDVLWWLSFGSICLTIAAYGFWCCWMRVRQRTLPHLRGFPVDPGKRRKQ